MVKSLNPYSPNHKSKMAKVLRAIKTMQADLLITRDSTRNLFKANMNRESRKKKKSGNSYIPAFERVLTEAEATRHREDEAAKAESTKQKKELSEARKVASLSKRLDAETLRQNKRVARAEKARVKEEMKAAKTAERLDRKRKREEEKSQKDMERASRPKRVYRKRLREPPNQEISQPIPRNNLSRSRVCKPEALRLFMEGMCILQVSLSLIFRTGLQLIVHIAH